MEELKDCQPEDDPDFVIKPRDRARAESSDDVIERSLPAEGSGGNLAGQGAVAFVAQAGARTRERVRKVTALVLDR